MNLEEAKKIIFNNCYGKEGSLVESLHNDAMFSKEKFWDYYDSIVILANIAIEEKSIELSMELSISYQRILKEFIYHFASNDISCIDGFPEDYNEYIERLDFAILAYFKEDLSLVRDERFNLKRNE